MFDDVRGDIPSKKNLIRPELSVSSDIVPVSENLPPSLHLIPVSHGNLLPGMMVPLILPEGKLSKTIDHVMGKSAIVGVVVVHDVANDSNKKTPSVPKDSLDKSKRFFRF